MSYTVKENKSYPKTTAQVFEAAQKAVTGLQGKILDEDAAAGTLKGQFDKKIHGKMLGDRSQVVATVSDQDSESTLIAIEVYPINPVGQKLMFGARQGVSQTVASWFWTHLEHNLG